MPLPPSIEPVAPRPPIGIIACSAEGASLCYRTICLEAARQTGSYGHPELSMHTHSFATYMDCIDRGDWQAVGALMLSSAGKLVGCGAQLLICPDNTIHQALPAIRDRLEVPFLHIADCVAEAAAARGWKTLGLTGTRWLVDSEVYPEPLARLGIGCVRPTPQDRAAINRIIMDELVRGIFRPESVAVFQRVIERMADAGCDAVVLGCTEIPLIIGDHNAALPTLDSTRLLARAALNFS